MALVACPHCGHAVSDTALVCVRCGRPVAPMVGTVAPSSPGVAAAPLVEKHPFFPVGNGKFIVLSLCSFGIYVLYWNYKAWQRIRDRSHESMSPFWRTFFSPLWSFVLFERVKDEAARQRIPVAWRAGVLGTLYLLLNVAAALPDPWWLVSFFWFVPLVPVVNTIEQINTAVPAAEGRNESYSGGNIATILIGGLLLIVVVLATLLFPERA